MLVRENAWKLCEKWFHVVIHVILSMDPLRLLLVQSKLRVLHKYVNDPKVLKFSIHLQIFVKINFQRKIMTIK
jgi:hypothetical protein